MNIPIIFLWWLALFCMLAKDSVNVIFTIQPDCGALTRLRLGSLQLIGLPKSASMS